ncbi:hypothetical protein ACFVEN_44145 [Streptomyces sp. NPDC057681]|uniref:hypothetical protein n=1 Tax=Streptomyces sp. NPDC057681 TaxID=3346209 RepID=UPI0036BA1D1A
MACPNDILDIFNPTAVVSCGADAAAKGAAGNAFEQIVNYFSEGASAIAYGLTMGWMDFPTPDLTGNQNADGYTPAMLDGTPIGKESPVVFLQHSLSWITVWLAILCLLISAGRMIWLGRGQPAKEALSGLITLVLVSGGGLAFIQIATRAGDSFSVWVVSRSMGCRPAEGNGCSQEFGKTLLKLIATDAKDNMLAVTFVVSLLIIISSYIQMGFLIARNAMLVLCAGTLPLAAAVSGSETGKNWFRKQMGWVIAFILFKPTAAVIYAAAFAGMGQSKTNDIWTQLYGVVLLLLAALTLPALMRFVTPLVAAAAVGNAGAGSALSGGVQAIATGAVAIKSFGSSAASKASGRAAQGAAQPTTGRVPSAPVPPQPGGNSSKGGAAQITGGSTPGNSPVPAPAAPNGAPAPARPAAPASGSAPGTAPQSSTPTRSSGGPSGSA